MRSLRWRLSDESRSRQKLPDPLSISPNRLGMRKDFPWGEPEPLHLPLAVKPHLIVVVRRRRVFRLAVRQQATDFLGLSFHHDHYVTPAIVAVDLPTLLIGPIIGMQNAKQGISVHRKGSSTDGHVHFSPRDPGRAEVFLDSSQSLFERRDSILLFLGRAQIDPPSLLRDKPRKPGV